MLHSNLTPVDSRCHGNEIWDKMGYSSDCVKDICEIFASVVSGDARRNFSQMITFGIFPNVQNLVKKSFTGASPRIGEI